MYYTINIIKIQYFCFRNIGVDEQTDRRGVAPTAQMKHSRQAACASILWPLRPFEILAPQKLQEAFARNDIGIAVGEVLIVVGESVNQLLEEQLVLEVDAQEFHVSGESAAHQLVVSVDVAGFVDVEREAVCPEDAGELDLDLDLNHLQLAQLSRCGVDEGMVSIEPAGSICQGYELHALGLTHPFQEIALHRVAT